MKAVDTPKSSAIDGNAGKYISIDNGPTATISPSIIIHATGKSAERTRSAALGLLGREGFGADIMRPYDRGRILLLLIRGLLGNFNRLLLQNKPFKNTVYEQAATQTDKKNR